MVKSYLPDPNDDFNSFITTMAASTGTISAVIFNIPNQPTIFKVNYFSKLILERKLFFDYYLLIVKNEFSEWSITKITFWRWDNSLDVENVLYREVKSTGMACKVTNDEGKITSKIKLKEIKL